MEISCVISKCLLYCTNKSIDCIVLNFKIMYKSVDMTIIPSMITICKKNEVEECQ